MNAESYYENELRGKSENEIWSKIRSLKKEINRLKDIAENPLSDCSAYEPSIIEQVAENRERLDKTIQALKELGSEYQPTKSEIKAIKFQENIPHIRRIEAFCGAFILGFAEYTLDIKGDVAEYKTEIIDNVLEQGKIEKETLLENLKCLNLGEWKHLYDSFDYGYVVLDGESWSVKFKYDNGCRPVEFTGRNCYPYNFNELLNALNFKYTRPE